MNIFARKSIQRAAQKNNAHIKAAQLLSKSELQARLNAEFGELAIARAHFRQASAMLKLHHDAQALSAYNGAKHALRAALVQCERLMMAADIKKQKIIYKSA